MTTSGSRLLRYLSPALLAAAATIAAANWYLNPARALSWATALAFMGVMAGMLVLSWRLDRAVPLDGPAAARNGGPALRAGVAFGAVMLMVALGSKLATELGLGSEAVLSELSKRITMALTGVFLVITGHAAPKMLTPLASSQCCDPIKAQAFQRFMGWTWVLTGLVFAAVWLTLPLDLAKPVAVTCVFAGMVIVATGMVRLVRSQRPRPS
jgi:hypothetical protein